MQTSGAPMAERALVNGRRELSSRSAVWLGISGVGLVVVLGAIILLFENGPLAIDSWWHDLMLSGRTDAGLRVARAFDIIGGVISMIVIGVLVVAAFVIARRPWDALALAAAMLACDAVGAILKVGFARERPLDSLSTIGYTSFPSGHTSLAAALTVALALVTHRRLVGALAALWIVLMAWSRTYLAAHWLSDTVGGAVLGASVALLVWSIVSELQLRTQRQPLPS